MKYRFRSVRRADQDAVYLFLTRDGESAKLTTAGIVWNSGEHGELEPFLVIPGRLWDVPTEFELPEE